MAEERMRTPWWHNYLMLPEWDPEWYDEFGELHHPEDAFHVHEIVVEKVEKKDVFKDPDTIVHADTWNDPTWRGILHLLEPMHVWSCIVPIHLSSIGRRTTGILVLTYP